MLKPRAPVSKRIRRKSQLKAIILFSAQET